MTVTIDSGATWQVLYDPGVTDTDISDYVISIDKFTRNANEVNTAVVVLDADFGNFISESNSGVTPILAHWDKLKITLTDKNDNTYSRIMLVKTLIRKRKQTENLRLEVHLVGQEFWLTRMPFPKPFYFENMYSAVRDIIDIYNDNNGTAQAEIENHDDDTKNLLPQYNANNYSFGLKEKMCWDGIMEILEQGGQSISNLGTGDFHAIKFNDKSGDETVIEFEGFSSGSKPASPITVQHSNDTPIFSIEEEFDSETATVVGAKGGKNSGSLPPEFAEFRDLIEAWQLIPEHISGVTYPSGIWVQSGGIRYQSNTETSQTPPHANWTVRDEDDWIGAKDYSPWTNANAAAWKNSGSNPSGAAGGTGTDFDQEGCMDSNLVILDEDNYQNWAHVKSTTDNFNVFYKYGAVSGGAYEGLRCLVNGTGTGAFTGYDNKLMQYDGSAWQAIGPRGNTGVRAAVDGDRIAIKDEGLIYKYNGSSWVDDHTGDWANHCFHIYSALEDSVGVNETDDGAGGTYGDNSAKKWTYTYTPLSALGALPTAASPTYSSMGAWANISFPFPETSHNSQTLGSIYGGNTTDKQPATLDADNLIYTPAGNTGFNKSDSRSLYPLTGIEFVIKMDWLVNLPIIGDTRVPFEGRFPYRIYFYDTSDNVVFADFTIPHLNNWTSIRKAFSEFQIYRARTPEAIAETASNWLLPDLEILDVFNWKDIKLCVIQWQDPYDEEGRYNPENSRVLTSPLKVGSFIPDSDTKVELYIDAFHFTKQAFELSGTDTTRPQFAFLESPDVTNTFQLQNVADSQEDIERFPYRAFDIDMELRCDIDAEDSFYLVDSELITDDDDSSGGVKVVARDIEFSVDASQGRGGIHTKIKAVKRING